MYCADLAATLRTLLSCAMCGIIKVARGQSAYVCLSVCLSQASKVSKRRNESGSFLAMQRLPSTYPTLCYEEIRVPTKQGYFPPGPLLFQYRVLLWLRKHVKRQDRKNEADSLSSPARWPKTRSATPRMLRRCSVRRTVTVTWGQSSTQRLVMDSSCRASLASTGCDEYRRRVVNAEINSSSVDLQALVSSANDVAFTSSQAEHFKRNG